MKRISRGLVMTPVAKRGWLTIVAVVIWGYFAPAARAHDVVSGLRGSEATCSWEEIDRQIARHQDWVKKCGPLSLLRVLVLQHRAEEGVEVANWAKSLTGKITVQSLIDECRSVAPESRAVSIAPNAVNWLPTPCILIVNNGNHCVTLEKYSAVARTATIWDPSERATKTLSVRQLLQIWDGDAIVFSRRRPTPEVYLGLSMLMAIIGLRSLVANEKIHARRNHGTG